MAITARIAPVIPQKNQTQLANHLKPNHLNPFSLLTRPKDPQQRQHKTRQAYHIRRKRVHHERINRPALNSLKDQAPSNSIAVALVQIGPGTVRTQENQNHLPLPKSRHARHLQSLPQNLLSRKIKA